MKTDMGMILGITSVVGALYLICRAFFKPVKQIVRLIGCCFLGGAVLAAINCFTQLHFAINPLTSMISGFLGIPGILMLYIIGHF